MIGEGDVYRTGDTAWDAKVDQLRIVMAEVRHCATNKNLLIRGHIMRGLELDRVDPCWKTLKRLVNRFPIDWVWVREIVKHFPTRTDLGKE